MTGVCGLRSHSSSPMRVAATDLDHATRQGAPEILRSTPTGTTDRPGDERRRLRRARSFWCAVAAALLLSTDPPPAVGASVPAVRMPVASDAAARRLFAGLAGLESPYRSDKLAAGELSAIIAAGYSPVAGAFGLHRFHHVEGDDARCIDPANVAATTAAFRKLLAEAART